MNQQTRNYVIASDLSMKIGTFAWLIGKVERLSQERRKLHLRTADNIVVFINLTEPYSGSSDGFVEVGGMVTGTKTVQCEHLLRETHGSSVLRDQFEMLRERGPSTSRGPLSNAEYLRRSREKEPVETTLHRRETERERQVTARDNESENESAERRQNNAERQHHARQVESAEAALYRRRSDMEHHRAVRQNESETVALERRQNDALRQQLSRENESEEATMRRMQMDAERKRRERAERTAEAAEERRAIESAARKKQRAEHKNQKEPETRYAALSYTDTDPSLHDLGRMDNICTACRARHFSQEVTRNEGSIFTNCCQKGAVALEKSAPVGFPDLLRLLFLGNHTLSGNFFSNIRKYNSAMGFASVVAKVDHLPGFGPTTYRISGQLYHFLGPAHAAENQQPKYGQLYFLDSMDALESRTTDSINSRLNSTLLKNLEEVLRSCSPYAKAYSMMREVEEAEQRKANQEQRAPLDVRLVFDNNRRSPHRKFAAPTCNEVAAIIVGDVNGEFPQHCLAVHSEAGGLQTIPSLNGDCDPMSYPLFFPLGTKGFHPEMQREKGGKRQGISLLEFYSYRIADRGEEPDNFSPILYGRALFQQYAVDAYIKVEESRLQYQRNNQKRLRADTYQGLSDYLASAAADRGMQPGRTVVLSSSFTGGPRAMRQNYQDAMSMCRKFGKPFIFLTKTLNPNCSEIKRHLYPGQRAADRPDLVARVFKLKLKELLADICTNEIFGRVEGYCLTIEFQKRGLPHCHMLIIIDKRDANVEPDTIDRIVCCEIPDPAVNPILYERVQSFMLHGPCGSLNRTSVCMRETGACHANFPKPFCQETNPNKDGYPQYRRRDTGRVILTRGYELDNSWVVPYNPYLLLKYNCHINVEICATVKSFKYIYKYIFKGHDVALMRMTSGDGNQVLNLDEIAAYVESRYICAPEACWRLNKYEMQLMSHSIVRLPVHKPDEQDVFFEAGQEEQAVELAAERDTMLTAWFKLNATSPEARLHLYHDIPVHYRFEKGAWIERVRDTKGKIIGRMYTVNPRDYERFYLRLLLLHVPGARSFEDLRTVEGEVVHTFEDAARLRGLLENSDQWIRCMEEAEYVAMPVAVRSLFVTILIYGHLSPTDARQLWERFSRCMCEDFRVQSTEEKAAYLAYADVNKRLDSFGVSLFCPYGVPEPSRPPDLMEEQIDRKAELEKGTAMISMMNDAQQIVVDAVLSAVRGTSEQKCFFVDAPGGTGKTFVFTALAHQLTGEGVSVMCMASTGIAGNLLPRGTTVHTGVGLPLSLNENSRLSVGSRSQLAMKLRNVAVILLDEAPMLSGLAYETIDKSFREIMGNDLPFGGKIMVLGGDFRQVLPVVVRGSKAQQLATCIKRSALWSFFKTFHLTHNVRANSNQSQFCDWLLQLGEGLLAADEEGQIIIPEQCLSSGDIVHEIFGDLIASQDTEELMKSVILCPTNEETLDINDQIVAILPGEAVTYTSVDAVTCDNGEDPTEFPEEFLYTLTPSGLPPHILTLKVGSIVMLLRNLDAKHGLCNGTGMIIKALNRYSLDCEILSGSSRGKRTLIPRIKLQPTGDFLPFSFSRLQFPVRVAFAMTINKAQGQTFERVGIVLRSPVFSHGQLYVAFSRARCFGNIKVLLPLGKNCTKNVVYKELFR